MKKNKIIVIVSLFLVVILGIGIGINLSFSNNKELNLKCDSDTIKVGESVTCTLKGNVSDYEVSAFESNIYVEGSALELEKVDVDSIWEGDGEGGYVVLYTDKNKNNEFNLLTFTISLKDTTDDTVMLILKNNSYFDEAYQERKLDDINLMLKVRR